MNTVRTLAFWFACLVSAIVTIAIGMYFIGLGLEEPSGAVLSVSMLRQLSLGLVDPVSVLGIHFRYVVEWILMQRSGNGWAIYGFVFMVLVMYFFARVVLWIEQQSVPALIGYSFTHPRVNIGMLERCYVELDSKGLPRSFPRLLTGHHLVCSLTARQDISYYA